jgi:hypothetical protein
MEHRSIHCPQCGTPFEVEIADDGRIRTMGCTHQNRRPVHGELTDVDILGQLGTIETLGARARYQPAPKALKDRWR